MLEEELVILCKKIQKLKHEGPTLEVKKASGGKPHKLYDTLSAFSNQNDGGIIVFGIDENNDYAITGVYDAQDLQKRVKDQANEMEPRVRPLFTTAEIEGKIVVSAEIPGIDLAERPCFYKGKGRIKGSYCRIGDSDEPMTEYEIYSYEAFRKNIQDDIRIVPDCERDSLDYNAVADYLLRLKSGKPHLGKLTDDHILQLMNMVKPEGITLAAEWIFGFYPQAYFPQLCVTAVVVPGKQKGETLADGTRFTDNQRIEGPLRSMLDESLSFIRRNLNTRTIIDPETGKRNDVTELPMLAVREIMLNALIHRDYSSFTQNTPIRIELYSDRLEVSNPGGLYGRISVDELGTSQSGTRNPAIATTMETIGVTENRYSGIPTIYREMENAGLPKPIFEDRKSSFKVVLYRRGSAEKPKTIPRSSRKRTTPAQRKQELLSFCSEPRSRDEICERLGIKTWTYLYNSLIKPMLDSGELRMTLPEKPQSKSQKYAATSNEA